MDHAGVDFHDREGCCELRVFVAVEPHHDVGQDGRDGGRSAAHDAREGHHDSLVSVLQALAQGAVITGAWRPLQLVS